MTPSQTAHPTEGERELLPCPFCGSPAKFIRSEKPGGYGWHLHWVACANEEGGCVETLSDGRFPAQVIDTWNTRSDVRPQGEEGLHAELLRAATRYIECNNPAAGLSPFVKENGRYGTKSPWTEMREAVVALSNQGKPSS